MFRPLFSGVLAHARAFSSSATASLYKLKTHQGTKKRWAALPSGKFKRAQSMKTHLNTTKAASRINRLGQPAYANQTQARALRRLLPYA